MHHNAKDLTGQKFGRLTAIEPTEMRSGRTIIWRCKCSCGNVHFVSTNELRNGNVRSCGCLHRELSSERMKKRRMGKHPGWKGGRRKSQYGYIDIRNPEHPRARSGYVFEHILVMEEIIGGLLPPGSRVHHINGIKDDNRPENLMLFRNERYHQLFHNGQKQIQKEQEEANESYRMGDSTKL